MNWTLDGVGRGNDKTKNGCFVFRTRAVHNSSNEILNVVYCKEGLLEDHKDVQTICIDRNKRRLVLHINEA